MSTTDGSTQRAGARASIVVLTFNGLDELTRPCLESIFRHTPSNAYELVIVDNASTDGTQDYLRELATARADIKLCLNAENKGYAGGNNDGIRLATGKYVVLLNNDTLVSEGWLDALLRLFGLEPTVGLVGPVTNSAGNEQRIDLPGLAEKSFPDLAGAYCRAQAGSWFETEKLGFFCVAIRCDVTQQVGLLDEQFGLGMFEDDDYCVRARKAGFKLAVIEDCFVYHKGSMSFKRLPSTDYVTLFSKNRAYFHAKHGITWTYSDIALATWKKIRSDIEAIGSASDVARERALSRARLMTDALIQLKHNEELSVNIAGMSGAERMVAEKHRQLMELSDWAASLKEQNELLTSQMREERSELMKMSDKIANLSRKWLSRFLRLFAKARSEWRKNL